MGNVNLERTAFPLVSPGIHLGDFFKTRSASLPDLLPMSFKMVKLLKLPSFSIMNSTTTFPFNFADSDTL